MWQEPSKVIRTQSQDSAATTTYYIDPNLHFGLQGLQKKRSKADNGLVLELLQIAEAAFENRQLGYFLITKKVATHYILLSNYSLALVSHFYPRFLNMTKKVEASKEHV